MKKSFQYVLAVAAAAVAAFSFSACGDDVTEVTEIRQEGMAVLEAGEKLSKQACDTTNVGEMLFVMDSSEAFICDGESWRTLKGKDGSDGKDGKDGKDGVDGKDGLSCSAKYVIDKAKMLTGVALSCGESIVDTIWNGADGKDGDDGTKCSAKSVKNKAKTRDGIEVTCGGAVVDTIWNGTNGTNGTSCTLNDEGDGKVTVTCGDGDDATTATLYKAMCGTKPYDPLKAFCSEGELYSCDDKPYDPEKQYCKLGSTVVDYGWLKDNRDNQVYKTVKIGDQVWMAENLNYSVNPGKQSWCYDNSAEYCEKFGRLYTWAAAMDSVAAFSNDGKGCGYSVECEPSETVRGICPEGWHLPDTTEWRKLFDAVGGKNVAGKMLKSANGWKDYEGSNGNGSDSFGFSALPAGYINFHGYFGTADRYAYFWSASEYNSNYAYCMYLGYDYEDADMLDYDKAFYLSVRCLQN